MLGFFLEQSGYNDEGLAMSLRLPGPGPDESLHLPRRRPRLSGPGRLPRRAGDLRASGLARALPAPPLAPRRHAGHPGPRADDPRVLGLDHAAPAALRAHRAPVAPGAPAPRAHRRRGLAGPGHAGGTRARVRGFPDHLDAPLDRAGLRPAGKRDKAHQQLERLRRLPEGRASGHWSTLGASLLEGELAIIEGDSAAAARIMAPAVARSTPWAAGVGNRRTSSSTCFWSCTGGSEHVERSSTSAQQRLLANPHHLQSLAALAWAYERQGDTALHRHACRQLVQRADDVGLAPNAPELLAARQVLQAPA